MLKLELAAITLIVFALILTTACSPQSKHPNQIDPFDGASYDSLTVAHAALSSLRTTVSDSYPQYKPAFNEAAAAYQLAFDAYSTFRSMPTSQPQAAMALSNLTVSIVHLETTFQSAMEVQPAKAHTIRQHTYQLRATHPNINISDVLTELQIAASVAATVPGAQPYAALAQVVITATRSAVDAIQAANGQPIDLSTLSPVAPIV